MGSLLLTITMLIGAFENAYKVALPLHVQDPLLGKLYSNYPAFVCSLSYANPFGFPQLKETNSNVAYKGKEYEGGIRWHYFGIPEYREDTLSAGLDWAIAHWIKVGCRVHDYILSIKTEEFTATKHSVDYGLLATVTPFERLSCTLFTNNIQHYGDDEYITPTTIFSCNADIFDGCAVEYTLSYDGDIQQCIWINGYITRHVSVLVGYSKELELSSAGVNVAWGNILLYYMLQHHSFLGNTHRFGITYASAGYAFPAHSEYKQNTAIKLNIQTCSQQELIALGIAPDVLCQRIIKYREMFGAVSTKSLYQLGFTTQQIRQLQEVTCNYCDDDKDEKKDYHKKYQGRTYISKEEQNKKIKKLFQSMIAADIPSDIAISLAEEYQKAGIQGILQSPLYKSLDTYQQKMVRAACGIQ